MCWIFPLHCSNVVEEKQTTFLAWWNCSQGHTLHHLENLLQQTCKQSLFSIIRGKCIGIIGGNKHTWRPCMTNNHISNLIQIKSIDPSSTVWFTTEGAKQRGDQEVNKSYDLLCNTSALQASAKLRRHWAQCKSHGNGIVKAATV